MSYPPTTTKGSADSTPVTTFEIDAPNIPITHTGTKATLGTVAVAGGGTGQVTLAAHGVVVGNGTSGVSVTAAGTATHVLTSNGASADPTFQVAPTAATGNYYTGTMPVGSSWSTSSSSFADGTNTGGNTLTKINGTGITVTAGAANIAGITFTPSSANAVYLVNVSVGVVSNTAAGVVVRLTDGTTPFSYAQMNTSNLNNSVTVPLNGTFVPGTASAVTIKIQLLASGGGTATLQNYASGTQGAVIVWTLVQLVP